MRRRESRIGCEKAANIFSVQPSLNTFTIIKVLSTTLFISVNTLEYYYLFVHYKKIKYCFFTGMSKNGECMRTFFTFLAILKRKMRYLTLFSLLKFFNSSKRTQRTYKRRIILSEQVDASNHNKVCNFKIKSYNNTEILKYKRLKGIH